MHRIQPLLTLCLLSLLAVTPRGSSGQGVHRQSDVLILVQPSDQSTLVCATYMGKVPRERIEGAMVTLARLAGQPLQAVEIDDGAGDVPIGSRRSGNQVQTTGTAVLGGPAFTARGAFILQPIIEAFRDAGRFDILFMVHAQRDFNGIRRFASDALTVELTQADGPYRYAVNVSAKTGDLPQLPLVQDVPGGQGTTGPQRARTAAWWVAILAGLACGGTAYALLLRRIRRAERRPRLGRGEGSGH